MWSAVIVSQQQYDVLIIGAGLMGLSMAASLQSLPIRIGLIDSRPVEPTFTGEQYDLRVFAITPTSQQFLQEIGVWDAITALRVSPYREMEVWDSEGPGRIHFHCQEVGEPQLGHIIENSVLQTALFTKIQAAENIEIVAPAELTKIHSHENGVTIETAAGIDYTAALVVGADGANSWVREHSGISMTSWNYEHHAIVATVITEKAHQKTARQRFMPKGPLAFLPLLDAHTSSIVWSTKPDHAEQLMALADEDFMLALAAGFDQHLGNITAISQRISFPLRMRHAKSYIKPHIALVGDAAHTIHPLAGQGANLGLADVAALAEVISSAVKQKRPIGAHHILRKYERSRRGENLKMIAGMEGFKHLFANENAWLKKTRSAGLNFVNRFTPIKRLFMESAR